MRKDSLNQENFPDEKNKDEKEKDGKKKESVNKDAKNKDEKKNEEKEDEILKEDIFEEKENEIEKELIAIINKNYGDSLLKEINFEVLITCLMDIIYNFIKTDSDFEERQIICTCINLWSMIIISQDNISNFLNFVFEIKLKDEIDFNNFILKGILFSNNIFLRCSFFKNLRSLTKSLFNIGEYSFLIKLLNLCMEKYFDFNKNEKVSWKFFYNLFEFLLETAFSKEELKEKISKNNLINSQILAILL